MPYSSRSDNDVQIQSDSIWDIMVYLLKWVSHIVN